MTNTNLVTLPTWAKDTGRKHGAYPIVEAYAAEAYPEIWKKITETIEADIDALKKRIAAVEASSASADDKKRELERFRRSISELEAERFPGKPDDYWIEVAYQCMKMTLQVAMGTFQFEIHVKDPAKKYKIKDLNGEGVRRASKGLGARKHFKRMRGFVPGAG